MFSKRKKLIISGCSYTDNYARQEKIEGFPIWGELLAEKLDMELINVGSCGYGNKAIYHTIIETMLKTKNIVKITYNTKRTYTHLIIYKSYQ